MSDTADHNQRVSDLHVPEVCRIYMSWGHAGFTCPGTRADLHELAVEADLHELQFVGFTWPHGEK